MSLFCCGVVPAGNQDASRLWELDMAELAAAGKDVPQLMPAARAIVEKMHRAPLHVGSQAPDLQRFTIFEGISTTERDSFLAAVLDREPMADRALGALVGLAVSDAVGAPLEFMDACNTGSLFDPNTLTYADRFNKFSLKPGQWTDDCSMGLCMADSLILRGSYDGSDMRVRFWNWWFCSYDNAFRLDEERSGSVGLGGNIAESLRRITDAAPAPRYEATTEDAGNGSLMRWRQSQSSTTRIPLQLLSGARNRPIPHTQAPLQLSFAVSWALSLPRQ